VWVASQNGDTGWLAAVGPLGTFQHVVQFAHAPTGVAGDSHGVMWIAIGPRNQVLEVGAPYAANGATSFAGVPAGADPTAVAAGPGAATVWFTDAGSHEIGEISGTTFTQYPLPGGVSGTFGNIVLGPDGNLWTGVTGATSAWVLRITPAGTITAFAQPAGSPASVAVLGAGPDGELWAAGGGALESVSTAGAFTQYAGVLPAGDAIGGIAADPGGADALWLTDTTASQLLRVTLQPPPPPAPPPAPPPPAAPPTLSAAPGPATVQRTSATLSGTIGATGAASVTYWFEYGTSTAYGATTTPVTTSVPSGGGAVSANLTGLAPYTTYHYRLVAGDCGSASCQTSSADETFTTGSTLAPAIDSTAGVAPISGTIRVRLRGKHRFATLTAGETIPLGSVVDARHGTVLIVGSTAGGPGQVASGQFHGGVFAVTQRPPSTSIVLVLQTSYAACTAPSHGVMLRENAKRRKHRHSKKVLNQVFGAAHGQFKTRGHYATAADEGTGWSTADRCDGTFVSVTAGQVSVTDFVRRRTVVLTAGRHYLAPRP
jgi:hypothetical protein